MLKFKSLNEIIHVVYKNIIYIIREYFDAKFDKHYGTDTSGIIEVDNLSIVPKKVNSAHCYTGVSQKAFLYALSQISINHKDFLFVDFGSGKGRALLLAAGFPFKEVIGIELSPILNEIANKNISIFTKRKKICKIKSICLDATSYVIPNDNAIFFFYNPFKKDVLRDVAQKITSASKDNGKKIIVMFYTHNPKHLKDLNIEEFDENKFFCATKKIMFPYDLSRMKNHGLFIYSNQSLDKTAQSA